MTDERAQRQADATRVSLAPYDPNWARMADAEAMRLKGALGDALVTVHHMGSTAIPGIAAKLTVDLMPVVTGLQALEAKRSEIEALGYLWRGEFGIAGRRYCVLERAGKRVFHTHFFTAGHENITTQLVFRDYLRAHRDEALAYEAIKREAAAAHPHNSLAYNDHKADWIRTCLERAKAWSGGGSLSP
jgi:GrpB-like predicted nucleotidyltransferase (UPF0157 family)